MSAQPPLSSNKPALAIDVDDVLLDMVYDYADWLKFEHQKEVRFYDGMDYFLEAQLGYTLEQMGRSLDSYYKSERHAGLPPLHGAIDSMGRLLNKYELIIVTARPADLRIVTEHWLTQHFPAVFKEVHFVGSGAANTGLETKMKVVEQFDAVALVDDSLKHVTEIATTGRKGILFGDYPWNKADRLPKGVQRAADWSAVERMLLP